MSWQLGLFLWTGIGVIFWSRTLIFNKKAYEGFEAIFNEHQDLPLWFRYLGFAGVIIFVIGTWPIWMCRFFWNML